MYILSLADRVPQILLYLHCVRYAHFYWLKIKEIIIFNYLKDICFTRPSQQFFIIF